ncbi:hypothetical protein SUGI_0350830 [Cryptomeria japonica]|nr:hypothetical protein SUGI_0350830 [Cryptomeria japonica]
MEPAASTKVPVTAGFRLYMGICPLPGMSLPPRKKPLPMTVPLQLLSPPTPLIQLVLIGHQWVMLLSLPMMPFPLLLLVDHKQALDLEQCFKLDSNWIINRGQQPELQLLDQLETCFFCNDRSNAAY